METPPSRPGKTVLGRGLGNLLGADNKPASTNADAAPGAGNPANAPANSHAAAAAGTSASPAPNSVTGAPEKSSPSRVTPGVGALLRGSPARTTDTLPGFSREPNGTSAPKSNAPIPDAKPIAAPSPRPWKLPLLLADLLLLGLVAALLLRAGGHPGLLEICLGLVAVGVGAWLACLAVLPTRKQK